MNSKIKILAILHCSILICSVLLSCSKNEEDKKEKTKNNQTRTSLVFVENRQLYYNSQNYFNICNLKPDEIYYVSYNDSIVIYRSDSLYGFINTANNGILIPARYETAWNFDLESGLAAVVIDDKMGFIDTHGKFALEPTYPYKNENYIAEQFIFENGLCFVPSNSGKLGMIDTNLNLVIDTVYKYIQRENDYIIVWFDDYECVLIDYDYRIVISDTCSDIEVTNLGFVVRDLDYTKLYLLDFDGVTVLSDNVFTVIEPIASIYQNYDEYNECNLSVLANNKYVKAYSCYNSYILIENATGRIISKHFWDDIIMLSDDVFVGKLDYYYFLFDNNGNFINK